VGRKYGLLTERQYEVLKLRLEGRTQEEVAKILGTTRENISIIEKRAWRKYKLAEYTIKVIKNLMAATEVHIPADTHLINIPSMVVEAANKAGVKLKANFTLIYDEIRFKARACVEGTKVVRPIKIVIFKDGSFEVLPD
jgi:Tfx family DNA-binding protein